MNKARRAAIDALIKQAEETKAAIEAANFDFSWTEELEADISTCKEEEEEYLENMPEGMKEGDKGSAASAAIEQLEEARSKAEELKDFFEEFQEKVALLDEIVTELDNAKSN